MHFYHFSSFLSVQHFVYGSQRRGPILQMCESQSVSLGAYLVTLNLSAWLGWRLLLPHPSPLLKNADSETMGFGKVTQLSTPVTPAVWPGFSLAWLPRTAPALWPRACLTRRKPQPRPSFNFTRCFYTSETLLFPWGSPS